MDYNRTIMATTKNTKETQMILEVINRFGCLHKSQISYFLRHDPNRPQRDNTKMINFLVSSHQVNEDGDILCRLDTPAGKKEVIDSIWTMLYILESQSTKGLPFDEDARSAFSGTKPETLGFFLDGHTVIKLVPVYNESDITGALFVQEHFYSNHNRGDENKVPIQFVFVLRNKVYFKELASLNLTINHRIALLSGEENERPAIKLMAPQKND